MWLRTAIEFYIDSVIKEDLRPITFELSSRFSFRSAFSSKKKEKKESEKNRQSLAHRWTYTGVNYQRVLLHPISWSRENDLVARQSHTDHGRRPSLRVRLWICIISLHVWLLAFISWPCIGQVDERRGDRGKRDVRRRDKDRENRARERERERCKGGWRRGW